MAATKPLQWKQDKVRNQVKLLKLQIHVLLICARKLRLKEKRSFCTLLLLFY